MKVFTCVDSVLISGECAGPEERLAEPGISDLSDVVAILRIIVLHAPQRAARLCSTKKTGQVLPCPVNQFFGSWDQGRNQLNL
jgi:hypothetical protein